MARVATEAQGGLRWHRDVTEWPNVAQGGSQWHREVTKCPNVAQGGPRWPNVPLGGHRAAQGSLG